MRKVFIQTYGCQMNEYDSEQMLQILSKEGFQKADQPMEADLLLINSCSVREKSEVKARSFLGRLAQLKKIYPNKVIGFGGCVGQTEGEKMVSKYPFLDFAFGTNNYRDLPQFIEKFKDQLPELDETEVLLPRSRPDSGCQAFITITNGCDKFCSYCIVPFTRGRELSRSPEDILEEAAHLSSKGIVEIMLLGQNVNSYWGKSRDGKFFSLYELLVLFEKEKDKRLSGLKRLRYTTSHPRDFDESLAKAFGELDLLCEYLHLPFQSGSDQVLKKMRRFYSIESYLKKMDLVKKFCPDIALSADVIVGFPGETRADFEKTMKVLEEVEFDNVYSFKYSPRPYTRSAKWEDDVPEEEKSERIFELQEFQRAMSLKKYQEDLSKEVEILVEGPSRREPQAWTGRTRKNRLVHFQPKADIQSGELLRCKVTHASYSWLKAEPLGQEGLLKVS